MEIHAAYEIACKSGVCEMNGKGDDAPLLHDGSIEYLRGRWTQVKLQRFHGRSLGFSVVWRLLWFLRMTHTIRLLLQRVTL